MADFLAEDFYSSIRLTPKTDKARRWLYSHFDPKVTRGPGDSVAPYPGYVQHVLLPLIREAELTVDGDLDEQGHVLIRVRA